MDISEILLRVQGHALWVGIAFGLVFVAMLIDLFTGLMKAKRKGELTTSSGLRKTASKATKYFLPILSCACIDLLLCAFPIYTVPFFTIVFAVYCMLCETKSVMENTRTKSEIKDTARAIVKIIKTKDDAIGLVEELVTNIIEDEEIDVSKEKLTELIDNK